MLLPLIHQAAYLDAHGNYLEADRVMACTLACCERRKFNLRFASSDGIDKRVLKTTKHLTYIHNREEWNMSCDPTSPPMEMDACYSVIDGSYIGNPDEAKRLDKKGIVAEKSNPNHNVASIGFCDKEQKWYGWSHRAISSFGIGDKMYTCTPYPDKDKKKKKKPIKTLAEAKKAAIAFADSVS